MNETKTVERELRRILRECSLNSFVKVDKIRKWIEEGGFVPDPKRDGLVFLTMLTGLLDDPEKHDSELVKRLIKAVMDLYLIVPQKTLGGKAVKELRKEPFKTGKEATLSISEIKVPPMEWAALYEDAMIFLRKKKFSKAVSKFDEVFDSLQRERTTYREIYRVYGNAGLAYVYDGEVAQGSACWSIALELNPNYGFAKDNLAKLKAGEFDMFSAAALLGKAFKNIQKKKFEMKDIGPEQVGTWPERKVLARLSRLGIKVRRDEFVKVAQRVNSTDRLSDELLYPQYKGRTPSEDDFVWMAAIRLWAIYCPEEPNVGTLNDMVKAAVDFSRAHPIDHRAMDGPSITTYHDYLERIREFIMTEKEGFLEYWFTTFEYNMGSRDDLIDFLAMATRSSELEGPVTELVVVLEGRDPGPLWSLVNISNLASKRDAVWKEVYQNLRDRYRSNCYLPLRTAHIFEGLGEEATADDCLSDALKAVEERVGRKVLDLESTGTTIYGDYMSVLRSMESIYRERGVWAKRKKEVKKISREVEKNKVAYSRSPKRALRNEGLAKALRNIEMEQATDSNAVRYFEFLKKFDIDFKTQQPVKTQLNHLRIGPKDYSLFGSGMPERPKTPQGHKVRSRGPCPCGSGKMYKNCCRGRKRK